jgi:hypothetical protein
MGQKNITLVLVAYPIKIEEAALNYNIDVITKDRKRLAGWDTRIQGEVERPGEPSRSRGTYPSAICSV